MTWLGQVHLSWGVLVAALLAMFAALVAHGRGGRRDPAYDLRAHPFQRSCAPLLAPGACGTTADCTSGCLKSRACEFIFISQVRHGTALLLIAGLSWLALRALDGVAQAWLCNTP